MNSRTVKFLMLSWITILLSFSAMAESATPPVQVTGKVFDPNGEPLIGVVVMEKGTTNATMTDDNGAYSVKVSEKSVLVFSAIGYKELEEPVNGRKNINVRMQDDMNLLDEVVVVGYGAQRKQFVVGSVSQVTENELKIAPSSNAQNLLAGKMSGLTTVQSYGTPGNDSAALLVRGTSTFNSSSPLILVDGVERQMNFLNPNDIASISILKDAATAAIYGVKGANGVILITTKSGTQGSSHVSYDGSVSFDTNTRMVEMCNAEQYVYWHNKSREMDGLAPIWTPERLQWMKDMGIYAENDWTKAIFNNYGLTHQHNVSATGGNDKVRYYTSVGYMSQDGIVKRTEFDRYNVRANIDANVTDNLRVNMNVSGTYSDRNWPGLSLGISSGTILNEFNPITYAFRSLPILADEYNGLPLGYAAKTYAYTPSANLETGFQRQRRWYSEVRSTIEYDFKDVKFLEGLKGSVFFAYNYGQTLDNNFLETYQMYKYDTTANAIVEMTSSGISESNYNKSQSLGWDVTIRPQLTYNREIGQHNISALTFFESHYGYNDTMTGYKKGYYSDFPVDISMGTTNSYPYTSGSYKDYGSAAFATRVSYAYAKKYLAEFSIRADGSYKFAPEHRWGYFPSIALGWVMSEEDFMKKTSWLDFFKLRASYGILGQDDTDEYLYKTLYASTAPSYSYVMNGVAQAAYYTKGYVYDNLTWSRTHTTNVGVEMRAFRNRLSFEMDVFYKLTTNILESESNGSTYSPSLGGNNPSWDNTGVVDNRGFDLTLGWTDAFKNGWSYGVKGILSWSRNRLLQKKITDDHPSYRMVLGQPMGQIYGYNALGLFQAQDQIDNYPIAPSGKVELGAIMYEDINGDGIISLDHDFVKIGRSTVPEMTFSFNVDVAYKNLSLTMLFQGATLCNYLITGTHNNGNMDNSMYSRAWYGDGNTPLYLVEDAWTPDNTDARYPRLSATTNANNAWTSTWWLMDGTYLRLKNLQLAYTLDKHTLRNVNFLYSAKVYLAGTNLLTFTEFPYLDPENPGLNFGYYPLQKTLSFGVNLTF